MVVKFKPNVGRAQYRGNVAMSSAADFGSQIKAQMDNIVANFKGMCDSIDSQSADILVEALQPTFDKSQDIVPVGKTGRLKDSGYLESRRVRGTSQVEIGYGKGGEPPYAVFVHENLNAMHTPPTQAKFLQQPLEEDAEDIKQRILDGIKTAAGQS